MIKKLVIGILAHVDAGKTTLAEGLLYLSGAVRKAGRVDHGDAFLDTDAQERARGITIFAKQAVFSTGETEITLLDTPGHVDFSAEMERTLSVLDCAVLVISGTDGVQGHTQTLWRLLKLYQIPVLLFVNKMDLAGADREAILRDLRAHLDENCMDFSAGITEAAAESIAVTDEALLERYLAGEALTAADIRRQVRARQVFPCYFGAALKMDGLEELLYGLGAYTAAPVYPESFGARVYKISRDEQGTRLTHIKIMGGTLTVKQQLSGAQKNGGVWREKVNQIRIYSGEKYKTVECAEAGTVCAVTGLTHTQAGMALGGEQAIGQPQLAPVLTYRVRHPDSCDAHTMLGYLRILEEEDPQLQVLWNEAEIHIRLMGEVQIEILTRVIAERFGLEVTFETGSIVYKETIAAPVIGIGHFEPLRHYAEVHLLLEPGARGSGVHLAADCSRDVLEESWQRLVLTHLAERDHSGVLTGAVLTDVKITLLTGRAHVKHTEGGDFRQATYRAVRHALMHAENLLLEPVYDFTLTVPQGAAGRALHDLTRMHATFAAPDIQGEWAVVNGQAPVALMRDYPREVAAYTKGRGQLFCTVAGYMPCHNASAVIAESGYDPERDANNPADSIFCAHGAGYTVAWNEVAAHAHMDSGRTLHAEKPAPEPVFHTASGGEGLDKELEEIFVRTYGPIKNRSMDAFRQTRDRRQHQEIEYLARVRPDDYLLVDGYNIIFAWDTLSQIAAESLDAARAALIDRLVSYQGLKRCRLILVFDAYRVKDNPGSTEKQAGITVVYTKEAETADMYIEKCSYDLSRKHRVKVATSDALEQLIILGHGAERISAAELEWEITQTEKQTAAYLDNASV